MEILYTKTNRITAGVDPGLAGAFAIINAFNVTFIPMPVVKVTKPKGKIETRLELLTLNNLFEQFKMDDVFLVIEKQRAFSNWIFGNDENNKSIVVDVTPQGTTSTFKTGFGYGVLIAFAIAHQIEYKLVSAQTWQRSVFPMMGNAKTKEVSIKRAKELYPNVNLKSERNRVDNHNYADALLIAHFGKLLQESNNGMSLYTK